MPRTILDVRDLRTHFHTRRGVVKAVDGVSFSLRQGETLGLVGESGCGKSITCLSIIRLVPRPAGRIVAGQVLLDGDDLLQKSEKEMREVRGRQISMMLQDPMTSLDPVFTIGQQVAEPIRVHQGLRGKPAWEKATEMLRLVRIPSPSERLRNYPHQMSGGMRQRIVAAMALACEPQLFIADEPTTALDVTIQAQLLKLLKEIQEQSGVAMIVVTHDFGIVARICDRVAVMYAGKVVESASVREIFHHPAHPYTKALMNSVPKLDEERPRLTAIGGQPPDLSNTPAGCSFEPRCGEAQPICREEVPPEGKVGEGHTASCWHVN